MIVTFAISNSDNKLTQLRWSQFVADVKALIAQMCDAGAEVYFCGHSDPGEPWQNALWAVGVGPDNMGPDCELRDVLRSKLVEIAGRYEQESVAWWQAPNAELLAAVQVSR